MNSMSMAIPAGLIAGQTWMDGHRHMVAVQLDNQSGLSPVEMVKEIDLDLIDASPLNRQHFDPIKAKEMEDSLREHGQTTPAILRPKPDGRYELVAGERRFRGCKAIGRPRLLCMVRDYTDSQAAEILLIENLKREDLSVIEEARIYQRLLELRDEDGAKVYTLQKIALRVHDDEKKTDRVARVLTLLDLPEKVREALDAGVIPMRVAFLVGRVADPKDRVKAGEAVLKGHWSQRPLTVKEAEALIASEYQVNLKGKDLDREDADILSPEQKKTLGFTGACGEANDGSCERCPWLAKNHPVFSNELATGNNKGKGETGVDPLTCTRAPCFQLKMEALWQQRAAELAAKSGATEVLPLEAGGADLQRWNSPWVMLDESPTGGHLNDWQKAAEAPKWKKILKGVNVPLMVAAGENGKPVLVVDKVLAITAGKQVQPELFAKAEIPGQKGAQDSSLTPEQKAEAQEAERLRHEEAKMQKAIKAETVTECLKELREKVEAEGPSVDLLKGLFSSITRATDGMDDLMAFFDGGPAEEEEDGVGIEQRIKNYLDLLTPNGLLAACVVASVWDDVSYSGLERAEDFQTMAKAVEVDCGALEKYVTKRQEQLFKEAEKARAEKLKPKLKSKGAKSDPARATEQLNADIVTAGILAEGDAQRDAAPSRTGPPGPGMLGRGPEQSCSGDAAAFAELFPELPRELSEELKERGREWRMANPEGDEMQMREDLELTPEGASELWKVIEQEIEEDVPAHLERVREYKARFPQHSGGKIADELGITSDEAYACVDFLIDEKHNAAQEAKTENWTVEQKAAALNAGTHDMAALIGVKPNRKDKEAVKEWDKRRKQVERKAAQLSEGK